MSTQLLNCLHFTQSRRRQWQPTPVLLHGKSHGWRSLVGFSPWGREESDTTERLHIFFSLSCIGEGNGNPLHCPFLENPRNSRAWWAAVYGVVQSRTRLTRLSSSSNSRVTKNCSKFPKPSFNRMWTMSFQMFNLDLQRAGESEIKLLTPIVSSKKQENSRKASTPICLCKRLWLTQQNNERKMTWKCEILFKTREYMPPEKLYIHVNIINIYQLEIFSQ